MISKSEQWSFELIEYESVRKSLQPPIRYLIALIALGNAVIIGSILVSHTILDLKQFLIMYFLLNLALMTLLMLGYFLGCQFHNLSMKRIVKKINLATANGHAVQRVEVTAQPTLAKLGLSAVRAAYDSQGNKYSVISFETSTATYQALIWPLPSLISYLGFFKQIHIAIPFSD